LDLYDLVPAEHAPAPLGRAAQVLLAQLSDAAFTGDELVRSTALDSGEAAAALMELELAGRVTLEDGVYRAAL